MKPETIQTLQQNIPELRELIAFLASEAAKLDSIGAMELPPNFSPERIAVETLSRKHAYDKITEILSPLIGTVQKPTGTNLADYVA